MRCCQNRSILHMPFQIPELLQSNPANIHNVVTLRDRSFRVATRHHGAQRRHISSQRLVQRKQPDILSQNVGKRGFRLGEVLLIRGNVLRV
jgi:hypothetical protein